MGSKIAILPALSFIISLFIVAVFVNSFESEFEEFTPQSNQFFTELIPENEKIFLLLVLVMWVELMP